MNNYTTKAYANVFFVFIKILVFSSIISSPIFSQDVSLDGKLGIGINPNHMLDVQLNNGKFELLNDGPFRKTVLLGRFRGSNSNAPQLRFQGAGSQFVDIGQDSSGAFGIEINDMPLITVTSDGNMGVGIVNPGAKLDVSGPIRISNSNMPLGISTELGNDSPMLNFEANFRLEGTNSNLRGGAFRIDTRDGMDLFQWLQRPEGETGFDFPTELRMSLSDLGNLNVTGMVTVGNLPTGAGDIIVADANGNLMRGSLNSLRSDESFKSSIAENDVTEKRIQELEKRIIILEKLLSIKKEN